MKKGLFATILCLLVAAATAQAKPARRGFVEVKQPDGTTLTIQRIGDERAHIALTEDGHALLPDAEGNYVIATLDASGRLVPTDVRAATAKGAASATTGQSVSADPGRHAAQVQSVPALTEAQIEKVLTARRDAAIGSLPQEGVGLFSGSFPTKGKIKALVLLVEYSDVKFKLSDPHAYFTEMLTKQGFSQYNGTGSCHDYFYDNSNGQFDPQFDVYGPVTLPNKQAYYGGNDSWGNDLRPWRMVTDAAELLQDEIDFSDYDMDKDGYVDNVYVYYAGLGEAGDGSANTVWPHSWEISAATSTRYCYNGVYLDRYACSNEWENGRPDGIGTFCHEFSHVMGLPDLYCTSGSQAAWTPGDWSVMDYGCYGNDSRTPIGYSSYERNALGWIRPRLIDGPATIELKALAQSNDCVLAQTEKEKEFFLFENRQQTGWDKYLPYHGMIIWHVDFVQSVWDSNSVNNNRTHQYVDLVEANGNPSGSASAYKGYPWPGTSYSTEFTATTSPAFKSWSGRAINLPITDIDETDGIITFDVSGGYHELAAPTGLSAEQITPGSFLLKWEPVEFAKDYLVSVADEDGTPVATDLSSAGATELTIDRLAAATTYRASVVAASGTYRSEASEVLAVTTADFSFDYLVPTAFDPIEVNLQGFTAAWQQVEGAEAYLLTVNALEDCVGGEFECGFGSGNNVTLPNGWTFSGSSIDKYTSTGNYGKASPSIKLGSNGSTLQTGIFSADVLKLSFWYRGLGTRNTVNTLVVEGLVGDDEWVELTTVYPMKSTSSAYTETCSEIPAGVRAVRFTYNKTSSGNVALDDVVITTGGGFEKRILPGYDGLNVGNATTWHVSEILPDILDYSYSVKAVDAAGIQSLASDEVTLNLLNTVAVSDILADPDGSATEYFNLQGIRLPAGNLCPGIYIRRSGGKAEVVRL